MMDHRRAYAFGLTTVLFWSTVATAFKLALQYLDIYQLILWSCFTSVIVLASALAARGELDSLVPVLREYWKITLVSALLNPLVYYLVLFAAYDRLPAQVAQPINYTWAIVLTFMSIVFLRQKIHFYDIAAAFVCYAGVVIIAGQGNWSAVEVPDADGVVLALASTVVWAAYWIINVRDERPPTIALCLNFVAALPLALITCLIMSSPLDVSARGLAGAAWVGLFEMGLAFLFWSHALKLAENTSKMSNLIFLSPFLSLVFIHFILGEEIYTTTWAGLVIIVAGLGYQQFRGYRREVDVTFH